ncbi:MAG: hypothetical protein JNL04_19170 [Rhodospirillaceae bacterium]|jgi:hypothetical protein|nr:hypothetical protein [Rhodospirillaceae bacterium]
MTAKPREQILKQIAELRRKMDPDLLDSAERMARAHLGLPSKPSEAVRLFQQAMSGNARQKAEILAEVERRVAQRKTRH